MVFAYEPYVMIGKHCHICDWRLFEASNDVRFCMYCDWHESDEKRRWRLEREDADA